FAGVLTELGLPGNKFALALLSFNAGVELGQIAVILAAYGLVGRWWYDRSWYRARVVHPVSLGIALIALYWTLERSFS
ncbi:MAG: HupE/UreJ family protein, partial [Saprospiraceae bacterium]|nr:HupE/UreJ family protein [Saprospiraceae bacterium]